MTGAWRPMEALRYRGPLLDLEGVTVDQFTVTENSFDNLREMLSGRGRQTRPGTYTKLDVDGQLWMSDTDAECRDQIEVAWQGEHRKGGRGLVHGLGLGCVVGALLDHLAHVDVVEVDDRVARLIGGWYEDTFPGRVAVHVGDAFTYRWPRGSWWDVVWHDVWPTLNGDNLAEMAKLHRSFGNRCAWQGSWGKELCKREAKRWAREIDYYRGVLA